MSRSPKIIFSVSGSGGHIYPAIAVADELKKRLKEVDILFTGAKDRIEMQKIPQAGYPIIGLWISGLQRKNSRELFLLPFKLIHSLWRSNSIIKKFCPDLVIGTGGYASAPLVYMASQKNIPVLIQEQNVIPGITNKKLGKYAQVICTAYEEANVYFKKEKIRCFGNPVREEITKSIYGHKQACKKFSLNPGKIVVLSLGGSQGASTLNQIWLKSLQKLIENDIQLLWQSGKNEFEKLKKCTEVQHEYIYITEFINNMPAAYAAADLIVSRAGALTISELTSVGKPSIIIPYPWSLDDHQRKNAKVLFDKKAALVIDNDDIDKILIDKILNLIKDNKLKSELSKNIRDLSKPKATEEIVEEILKLLP